MSVPVPDEAQAVSAGQESEATGAAAGSGQPAVAPRSALSTSLLAQRYGLLVIFCLVIGVFSLLLPDSFPTLANARNITSSQSVLGIVSLAALPPLVAGQFDMSLGAVLGLASIAAASALSHFGAPVWLAALVGLGCGAFVGLCNGLLIAKVGVNPLITTLGVATAITGVLSWYTDGIAILTGIPDSLTDFGSGLWLGIPAPLYALAGVSFFVWYLLEHTPFGRHLHAIGVNPTAAHLVGLNVASHVVASFVLSGALVGLGGVLLVARQGAGNPLVGSYYLLPVLSAVFLGATAIHPGRFNVPGTLVAVFFLATSVSGLALFGVDNWVDSLFNGAALVIAVGLSTVLGRRGAGRG